jgi:Ni,Fe-hydrogenase I small subunit
MAVTRREFVTTLGLLASAVGMGQTDMAKVVEAFGHASPVGIPTLWHGDWTDKPRVVWVHGAECTGCSTSLLSLFEDATGVAVPSHPTLGNVTSAQALAIVAGGGVLATPAAATYLSAPIVTVGREHPSGHRTLNTNHLNVDGSAYAVNIADVLIDFISLEYHETVMGMGGDGAYAYLYNEIHRVSSSPFVLVVEGAVQDFAGGGYWDKPGDVGRAPWCAIAKDGTAGANVDLSFDDVVEGLAARADCVAIVAIGQCATFGGYPACIGPDLPSTGLGHTKSQTGAKGVFDFLVDRGYVNVTGLEAHHDNPASDKVVNVPGCPANPWWFTLTVVAWLVDAVTATGGAGSPASGALGILNGALEIKGGVDSQRRLTAVYGHLLHGKYCPRYPDYAARKFVSIPGESVSGSTAGGCLKNIGCKGLSTMSMCGRHGWNAQQPQNTATDGAHGGMNPAVEALAYKSTDGVTKLGGFCMTAGAPCMGCTEKGYPDAFTPFVVR